MLMWGGLTQLPLLYLHPQPRHKRSPSWLQGSRGFIWGWGGRPGVPGHTHGSLRGGFLRSFLDRAGQAGGIPQESGWSPWAAPHRMIWLVKLRLSSLCGRTIEFKISTSAGIRTRQPEAWRREQVTRELGPWLGSACRYSRPGLQPQ